MIINTQSIRAICTADVVFKDIFNTYGRPPDWQKEPGFSSLCKIILEQQVSVASANAHFNKLEAYIGDLSPNKILKLTEEGLRQCYISRQKGSYLQALSAAIFTGDLELKDLGNLPVLTAKEKLMRIKGIGNWTAEIYLIFCQQEPDILPLGDIAVYNTMKELWAVSSKEEAEALAKKWSPYRSVACFFLWHYYLETRKLKIKK